MYPVLDDSISGFYSNLVAIPNIPAGMLQAMCNLTVSIFPCINDDTCDDRHTAKLDFDNEVRVRARYGVSCSRYLQSIIDSTIHTNHETTQTYDGKDCFHWKGRNVHCNSAGHDSTDRLTQYLTV